MNRAEFDQFADEYYAQHKANIAITGEAPEYFAEYKIAELRRMLDAAGITASSILDFGSGIGNSIPHFRTHFANVELTCADTSLRSLELARARFPGAERPLWIEGDTIPASDDSFDVVFSACVFHHVSHTEQISWFEELRRVTRPRGLIAVFEHNPFNPLTVRAVDTCPFDANAVAH